MAATLTSTGVTFTDGTSLATAAPANTVVGGLLMAAPTISATSSHTVNRYLVVARYDNGSTVAGSGLAYNIITTNATTVFPQVDGGFNFGSAMAHQVYPFIAAGWSTQPITRQIDGGRQNVSFPASGSVFQLNGNPTVTWSNPAGSYRNVIPCSYTNLYGQSKVFYNAGYWTIGMWQRYV